MTSKPWRSAIAAAIFLWGPDDAGAGAWTLSPGSAFVSASTSWYGTDDGEYEEVFSQVYGEWGLTDGVTIGGALEYSEPVGPSEGALSRVTGAAFARFRLHEGPAGDPFSLQIGAIYAEDGLREGEPLQRSADGLDLDARALYGRGFATTLGAAFFDAQAGVRLRLGDSADEVRVDLTAGLRPAPRWLLLVQSFGTLSLRNGDDGDSGYDALKLAPSAGYEIRDGVTLGVGLERDVAGRNISEGTRVKLFVWSAF